MATLVCGFSVDISEFTIHQFLYGLARTWALNMAKFDYRWDSVRSEEFQQNAEKRETILHWLTSHIAIDEERASRVYPTQEDNVLTWDRAVMVVALVVGFEIDFDRMLIAEIHERDFRATTTLPFPYLIFQLCRVVGVPLWHCDKLVQANKTLDIDLIGDEANIDVLQRETHVEVSSLGLDLIADVEQMHGVDPSPPSTTDDSPASPSQAASRDPSSARVTLSSGSAVMPVARVQKLEAQMTTLFEHAVNEHLDTFELRALERPASTTDVTSFRKELDSLRADLDTILAPPTDEPESTPTVPADDTVLVSLFREYIPQPESIYARGKRPCSSHISDAIEDA
uniref:Integrase core domain containing protein n=1 Tax=Solanum tuberosum TaxID=4113 RepID=M1DTQ1_SOLTU